MDKLIIEKDSISVLELFGILAVRNNLWIESALSQMREYTSKDEQKALEDYSQGWIDQKEDRGVLNASESYLMGYRDALKNILGCNSVKD
jgi:hypothetical protein